MPLEKSCTKWHKCFNSWETNFNYAPQKGNVLSDAFGKWFIPRRRSREKSSKIKDPRFYKVKSTDTRINSSQNGPKRLPGLLVVQVNNYEIVETFFINLTIAVNSYVLRWSGFFLSDVTKIYPVCSTYELTKQFM